MDKEKSNNLAKCNLGNDSRWNTKKKSTVQKKKKKFISKNEPIKDFCLLLHFCSWVKQYSAITLFARQMQLKKNKKISKKLNEAFSRQLERSLRIMQTGSNGLSHEPVSWLDIQKKFLIALKNLHEGSPRNFADGLLVEYHRIRSFDSKYPLLVLFFSLGSLQGRSAIKSTSINYRFIKKYFTLT